MNKGEELFKAWQVSERACNECERLVKSFSSHLKKFDRECAIYKKRSILSFESTNSENETYFSLPKKFIQVFKLKDENKIEDYSWAAFYIIFDKEWCIRLHDVEEPLLFVAKVIVNKKCQDAYRDTKQMTAHAVADDFDFFDEECRKDFDTREFPRVDFEKTKKPSRYKYKDDIYAMEAKIIGYPLVSINNEKDIIEKLIKPLFA